MSISFAAKFTFGLLRITNFKRLVEKRAKKPQKRSSTFTPKSIQSKYEIEERSIQGSKMTTFERKESKPSQHIIYLHGGAYIFGASGGHWTLLEKIMLQGDFRVSVLDYPLSPEKTYREAYEMIGEAYDLLLASYPADGFVLMGDSAGAALAMGLCQKLILERKAERIASCVLISPWLDITMSNPAVADYVRGDVILSLGLLEYGAKMFSGGDDQDQYLLSPINGEIKKFPRSFVLYASEEVFKPDCELLRQKSEDDGAPFKFSEFKGMQHAWPVFPIPEQQMAIDEITDFLLGG